MILPGSTFEKGDHTILCLPKTPGNEPDPHQDQESRTDIGPEIHRCPDYAETKKLREQERERRRREGKPYHEFLKEWSQKQPREDNIRSYGPWPEGIK